MHFGYRRVGHHAGGRAHGIGHIAMRWKDHLAIQPARQFAVKHLHRPAHRYHRHGRFDADARQAQGLLAVANRVADAVFGQRITQRGVQDHAGAQAHGFAPDRMGVVPGALGRGHLHLAQPATQLRRHVGRRARPVGLQVQHMSGVGGRETGNLNQAFALQGGDRPLRVHGCGQRPQGLRAGPHQAQQLGFAGRQLVAHAGRGRAKGQ